MSQHTIDPFKDVLVFNADLPVNWEILLSPPDSNEFLKLRQHNAHVLDTVLAIDDPIHEFDSTDVQNAQYLRHMDSKLNLLLHWTACLMHQSQQLPQRTSVKLSRNGIAIRTDAEIQVGTMLIVKCFPAAYFPQPLTLYGQAQQSTGAGEMVIVFKEVSEHVGDQLDKFIFRWHRRSVALSREHKSTDSRT